MPPLGAFDDGARQRMFAGDLEAGRKAQHLRLAKSLVPRHRGQLRLAERQRARLVDDERIDVAQHFDRLRVSEQHAHRRALASGHHDGHWRRQAEGTRTRDDEDRDGIDERVRHSWRRPDQAPHDKRRERHQDHGRHEIAGHDVREFLNRRAAPLRLGDHGDDAREECLGADLLGAHHQGTRPVDRRAHDLVAGLFPNGNRLAADHRLVHAARAFQDDAVHRNLLAGPHAQPVALLHEVERHVFLASVVTKAPR